MTQKVKITKKVQPCEKEEKKSDWKYLKVLENEHESNFIKWHCVWVLGERMNVKHDTYTRPSVFIL